MIAVGWTIPADIAVLFTLSTRVGTQLGRPGSACLPADELRLLAWLAYAQRETAMDDYHIAGLTIDAPATA